MPHQRDRRIDRSSADLAAGLAEIGLTPKAAWYSAAALWGAAGLLAIGLYVIGAAWFPRDGFYLGCVAVVTAVLSLAGGLWIGDASSITEWTTHARMIAGLALYIAAAAIDPNGVVAFALLPLLSVPNPCYLCTWRLAVPYVVAAASIVYVALILTGGTAHVAHALVSTCAVVAVGAAMIVTRQRTLGLARRNRRLAYTDALTGIANMRRLRERISDGARPPGEDEQPLALFAMDLDNFKQVNDRFDHSTGDRVLCAVAVALDKELDPSDVLVRRGGDEFALLVPNPDERNLDALRERLESTIARARSATCPQITPTGSVGYIRALPGERLDSMIERADQALHDAKIASRELRPERSRRSDDQVDGTDVHPASGRSARRAEGPETETEAERTHPSDPVLRTVADALRHADPDWKFAALLLALGAIVTASLSLAQMIEPLTPLGGTLVAASSAALALGCTAAGISGLSRRWLHLPWLAAYGLLAVEIALAGPSGAALLDLIPAIVMYGFLVFEPRTAALYLLLGQGMYGAFAIGGGFSEGAARTVISTVVVVVVGGLVAKLRHVTVRFTRKSRELSELDPLTGVGNVRALRSRVLDTVERASSARLHPVVVAIDLDGFKQVNDLHSHSTGDRVLIAVAQALSGCVRPDDLVARRGGDEFVVVIDHADSEYADTIEQRIADTIARARRRICPDLCPSATIASVSWQPGATPDDLLHAADIALHNRKVDSRATADLAATA